MQGEFQAEAARETAKLLRDLQAVTAAQAMPALCFLVGAYAPRRPVGRQRDDTLETRYDAGASLLRSQLKIVKNVRRG